MKDRSVLAHWNLKFKYFFFQSHPAQKNFKEWRKVNAYLKKWKRMKKKEKKERKALLWLNYFSQFDVGCESREGQKVNRPIVEFSRAEKLSRTLLFWLGWDAQKVFSALAFNLVLKFFLLFLRILVHSHVRTHTLSVVHTCTYATLTHTRPHSLDWFYQNSTFYPFQCVARSIFNSFDSCVYRF